MSSLHKHLERIKRMHRMIKFKRTGTPQAFAEKIGVSVSLLYRLMGDLREMGAPIEYDQTRASYYYSTPVELQLGFVRAGMATSELRNLTGGHQAIIRPLELF